jgi:hypothetical protein
MSGTNRLRIGGWVRWPDRSPADRAADHPLADHYPGEDRPPGDHASGGDYPAGEAVTAELAVSPGWNGDSGPEWPEVESEPWPTGPDGEAGTDLERGGHHRRRRASRLGTAGWPRRAAVAAVAVGGLLVGTGVLAQVLGPDQPAPLPAPPTPPLRPGPDPLVRTAPTGSPGPTRVPSPSAEPTLTPAPVLAEGYEAEAAELGSHGQVISLSGASGGQVVRLSGRRDGTFVQFTGVTVPEPGGYRLTVFYASEQPRTATVVVNDGSPQSVSLTGDGAGVEVSAVSLRVELASGGNTIWIGTAGGAPVALDQIEVSD